MIDGCSRAGAFWRVTFPLLAPGLIATGVFGFIQAWNEFVMALVLNARPDAMTLPVWLPVPRGQRHDELGGDHGRLDPDGHSRDRVLPVRAGPHDSGLVSGAVKG